MGNIDRVTGHRVINVTKATKDDRKSYRGQLLRDLKKRAPKSESKPDEKKTPIPSESVLKNVKSDPYLAELRSKYKAR